ncbi:MAG: AmmeMemoRadiSam system protein B [Gammaproteobacteria bacterium]
MTSEQATRHTGKNRIRPPAVAGLFYPDNATELEDLVDTMLAGVPAPGPVPKALIAPHAGYPFSGPVAAHAYAALREARRRIRRVVLLGPAHRVYLRGLALPGVDYFTTPLGPVEIDKEVVARIVDLPQVSVMEEAHREEHSLEVHLPFLQRCLQGFQLLPLVVGDAPPEQIAEVLEHLWGEEDTLILISSDLSHYHDYETASAIDADTVEHIRNLELEAIGPHQACGCMPIRGLLHLIRKRNMTVDILDVRNSGDTAGPRNRVVGYGSFAIYSGTALDVSQRRLLHEIARASIYNGLRAGEPLQPDPVDGRGALREKRGAFVTLKLDGRLRGCIGSTEMEQPLNHAVAESAFKAAFHDPRFPALSEEEFRRVDIRISVLIPGRELQFNSEQELLRQLRAGTHGLTISAGDARATFLPSVWEDVPDAEYFLRRLKQKAGLPDHKAPERAWVYTAESF